MLRDPYWPLAAARALGVKVKWPVQYERARLRRAPPRGRPGRSKRLLLGGRRVM
jgi:hypothetical protein